MADYTVSVDVNVNDSELTNLESRINAIKSIGNNNGIRVSVDTGQATKEVANLDNRIDRIGQNKPIKLRVDSSGVKKIAQDAETAMSKLAAIQKKANSIKLKIGGLDASSNKNQIAELESQLSKLNSKFKEVKSTLSSGDMSGAQWNKIQAEISATEDKLRVLDAKFSDVSAKMKSVSVAKFNDGTYASQVAKIQSDFNKLDEATDKAKASMTEFRAAYQGLSTAIHGGDMNEIISQTKQYESALQRVQNQIKMNMIAQKEASAVNKATYGATKLAYDQQKFGLSIDKWLKENSKVNATNFAQEIGNIREQIQLADRTKLTNLQQQFQMVQMKASIAGQTGLNFVDRLKMQWNRLGAYFGVSGAIMTGMQALRSMFNEVVKVDTAMTELKRVTDLSSTQYTMLYSDLTTSAKEYGTTLSDIINATADWSRAGFEPDVAKGLAEVTTMYQHIADVDYQTAFENLQTSYKGFEKELNNMFNGDSVAAVSYIGDILNELDNNYAVTADGVGEAMKRAASAMSVAGNTIQETAGMITGITEVTQDPEKAGNALKVVSMRLRGKTTFCLRTRKVCTLCFALNCKNIEDSYIRQSARVA